MFFRTTELRPGTFEGLIHGQQYGPAASRTPRLPHPHRSPRAPSVKPGPAQSGELGAAQSTARRSAAATGPVPIRPALTQSTTRNKPLRAHCISRSHDTVYAYSVPVWLVDSDGGTATVVIQDGWAPAWAPDGASLAFCRGRFSSGYNEIYVARSDGSDARRLTRSPSRDFGDLYPEWSPDGRKISFTRDGLYVMCSDGTAVTKAGEFGSAVWSPDSNYLAATRRNSSRRFGRREETAILAVNVARLFAERGDDEYGDSLRFDKKNAQGFPEIEVATFRDRPLTLLDTTRLICWDAELGFVLWRPDGRVISVSLDAPLEEREVCTVPRQLGPDDHVFSLALSSDRERVAYTQGSNRALEPPRQLLAAAVGSLDQPRQLTDVPRSANTPRWSPDGSGIAFWTEEAREE